MRQYMHKDVGLTKQAVSSREKSGVQNLVVDRHVVPLEQARLEGGRQAVTC